MADYSVGNAPQGASYAAPLVGFQLGQQIAGLPDAYMKGRENQRTIALQNAFPDGVPKNPDGSPDIDNITSTLGKIGGGQYVQQLMPYLLNAAQGQRFSQGLSGIDSYVNGGAPGMPQPPQGANTGPAASSNATGPANLQPRPQASATPQPQGAASQPTVMKILDAQGIPNDQLQAASDSVARQLGVNPTDPIDPSDPRISNVLGPAIQQLKRMGIGQVQPPQQQAQATPQPQGAPQPAQPQQSPPNDEGVPGADEGTMKRLAFAAGRLRAAAAGMASTNPAQAQALENQAKAYDDRAKQIFDTMAASRKQEYEHELSREDLTPEQKNARDTGVTKFELTKEQNKNDVDRFGKQYDTVSKIGEQADETLPQLDLAKRLVNSPEFASGTFAPASDAYKRLVVAFGLDPNKATPDQVFDKIRAGSILNQIKGMAGTGPVRVAEMKFIDQMIAGRENSPSTLRTLLEIESRLYQRAQAVRDMAHNYNGGHLDNGFEKNVAAFKNDPKNAMFSKEELKDPRLIAPPVFNTPQELRAARLPHGEPFKTADGRIKYVP